MGLTAPQIIAPIVSAKHFVIIACICSKLLWTWSRDSGPELPLLFSTSATQGPCIVRGNNHPCLCRHVPTCCLSPSNVIARYWISARINVHFLNMGKWDITLILSLNCFWLVLPASYPNCAMTAIWAEYGALVQICITVPFHRIELALSTLMSASQHRSLSRCVKCLNHIFVVCQKEKALILRETCSRVLATEWLRRMDQQGRRPRVKQGLCLTGNKNFTWTSHECLECQAAVVQKVSLFISIYIFLSKLL